MREVGVTGRQVPPTMGVTSACRQYRTPHDALCIRDAPDRVSTGEIRRMASGMESSLWRDRRMGLCSLIDLSSPRPRDSSRESSS